MPIEQHPIPQDVSNYKFRLVGDMTLKQFLQLAVGVVIAIGFWNAPLPFFFKYPLAILSACLGIGMAFVPIEGRPLDQWLIAFVKSIYSPTIYVWQKSDEPTPATATPLKKSTPLIQSQPINKSMNNQTPNPTPNTPINPTPSTPNPTPVAPSPQTTPTSTNNSPSTPLSRLPIPFTPTTPNTLVGMVLTADNHIIEDAIVEITHNGLTVRATKSNKLGQFLFARPLDNGTYYILTQKSGYTFETYALNLNGQIIPPLKLQAKP